MDLKELELGVNPDVHWYYQSKTLPLIAYTRKVLESTDPVTIVDVGSGSGFFAITLEKKFGDKIKKVYLVDLYYTQEEMAATKGQKIEKVHYIPEKIENGLVILMDVLEHLEDDLKMLNEIKAACVGSNNYFFITVPAFYSLWSGHDVYLGHYRRYKIDTLSAVLNKAHFNIKNTYYLYGSLFPMVWLARKVSNMKKKEANTNMKPFSPVVNKVLYTITSIDMALAKANKLFGVSCVAQGKI
jgi:SAM-dependent methyltransferase